nr:uncharacterized protein LOC122172707 [Chrysemys picta bellii]
MSPSPSLSLVSDVSDLDWGGVHLGALNIQGSWLQHDLALHISVTELKAVHLACQAFLPHLRGKVVKVLMDNMAEMYYINRQGGARSSAVCQEALSLWNFCMQHAIHLVAAHLPGINTVLAHHLSRIFSSRHGWADAPSPSPPGKADRTFPGCLQPPAGWLKKRPASCRDAWRAGLRAVQLAGRGLRGTGWSSLRVPGAVLTRRPGLGRLGLWSWAQGERLGQSVRLQLDPIPAREDPEERRRELKPLLPQRTAPPRPGQGQALPRLGGWGRLRAKKLGGSGADPGGVPETLSPACADTGLGCRWAPAGSAGPEERLASWSRGRRAKQLREQPSARSSPGGSGAPLATAAGQSRGPEENQRPGLQRDHRCREAGIGLHTTLG